MLGITALGSVPLRLAETRVVDEQQCSMAKAFKKIAEGISPPRKTSESIRLWIEAVGIPVVVAALGVWQFWLKEVVWPSEAPVNLTTDLSVKEAGLKGASGSEGNALEAIELEVTARNPSTRPIYVLNNIWTAYGVSIEVPQNKDWLQIMADELNGDHQIKGGAHYIPRHPIPVAVGNVFQDTTLQPNEKIVRTFVFYVPQGTYDYLEVDVGLPTTAEELQGHPGEAVAGVDYALRSDRSSYSPTVYRIKPDGTHQQIAKNEDTSDLGLQWAISTRMLSLWQSNSMPPEKVKPPDASP